MQLFRGVAVWCGATRPTHSNVLVLVFAVLANYKYGLQDIQDSALNDLGL